MAKKTNKKKIKIRRNKYRNAEKRFETHLGIQSDGVLSTSHAANNFIGTGLFMLAKRSNRVGFSANTFDIFVYFLCVVDGSFRKLWLLGLFLWLLLNCICFVVYLLFLLFYTIFIQTKSNVICVCVLHGNSIWDDTE